MMRIPTRSDIYAAELKVSQSQRNTKERLVRVDITAKKALQRITTMAIVAGVVGLSLIWLVSRRPKVVVTTTGTDMIGKTSALGLILAFLLRYGKIGMPLILHQIRKTRSRPLPPGRALLPNYSDVNYISNKFRH